MKKIIYLFAFLFTFSLAKAQDYVKMMSDNSYNFYQVQQAFNNYWQGKTYQKGKGWKQFKRWEYFMEPRINALGIIPNPSLAWEEYHQFKEKYKQQKGAQNNKAANWTPLGPTSWNSIGWNPGIGRINGVTVDPSNSNIIYVGTPAGGCWKSIDNGSSWLPLRIY